MKKEFIPYEQALVLKELGFDEKCLAYYKYDKELYQEEGVCYVNSDFGETMVWDEMLPNKNCTAPLYQQAFRWFREKYGLYFSIQYFQYDEWCLQITTRKEDTVFNYKSIDGFKTYEEAELACLIKLIKIVKTNDASTQPPDTYI